MDRGERIANPRILWLSHVLHEGSSIRYLPIRFNGLQQWTIFGTFPFDSFRFTQSEGEPNNVGIYTFSTSLVAKNKHFYKNGA